MVVDAKFTDFAFTFMEKTQKDYCTCSLSIRSYRTFSSHDFQEREYKQIASIYCGFVLKSNIFLLLYLYS